MAKFGTVLKKRNFFLLWLSQIISQFGDRLNQMALIGLISARAPGSAWQLAKVLTFTIIPVFIVGPIAASYVDRWDRRRTMLVCDLLRAALVGLIACCFLNSAGLWPIYLIIFLVFSLSRFFVPAKMAIIPELVAPNELLLANSLASVTGMVAAVAGFGLGGIIVERFGPKGGFSIDAFSFLASALLISLITAKSAAYFRKEDLKDVVKDVQIRLRKTLITEIKEGWLYLARERRMRALAQMLFLLWSALGAVYVVLIVFVQKTLGTMTADLGIMAMALGLGLFAGSLIYGRFGERLSKMKMMFASLGASGLVLAIFTVFLKIFASKLFAIGSSFVLGLALAPILVSSQTLVHEVAHEKMRGRVFGSLEVLGHLAFVLFMFLTSLLAEKIDRYWILLFIGASLAVFGFGAALLKDKPKAD